MSVYEKNDDAIFKAIHSKSKRKPERKKSQSGREKRPLSHATRAHNPSREGSNAIIKHISVQFNHFHPHLNDRSTRTARISNPKSHETHKKRASLRPIFYIRRTKPRKERFWQTIAGKKTHTRERENETYFLALRHGLSLPPVARLLWSESRLIPIVIYEYACKVL